MSLPTTFFILGAAKSGTTSLQEHLAAHPEISMAAIKETNFLVGRNRRIRTEAAYRAQFVDRAAVSQFGESSHLYFSVPECADRVRAECPDARFLLVLRDPVERAHSLYCHNRAFGWEQARTFERALALEPGRVESTRFQQRSAEHPASFQYVGTGRYDEQLERYLERFSPERFLITTFEEFTSDPESFLLDCHRFLGVTPTPLEEYGVSMRNTGIPRFAGLARRVSNSYAPGGPRRRRLARRLRRSAVPVPVLRDDTRLALRAELAPSVRRLSEMLDRPPMWWTDE